MSARWIHRSLTGCILSALACSLISVSMAAELAVSRSKSDEGLDLFQAIADKLIDVKFIAHNDKEAQLLIHNVADRPLAVNVPGAFAGVPVLGQAAQRAQRAGGAAGGGGGGAQGLGGGGGGGQGGGGVLNIAPEKVAKVKAVCVCLDHGKPDPNPRMEYEIRPINSYATDPAVEETIKLMVEGKVSQRVAQIAAWHLQNHMSFEQLANEKIKHLGGIPADPMFSMTEIKQAMVLVQEAKTLAEINKAKNDAKIDAKSTPLTSSASAQ